MFCYNTQVIDHARNGESLVIGLVLRRWYEFLLSCLFVYLVGCKLKSLHWLNSKVLKFWVQSSIGNSTVKGWFPAYSCTWWYQKHGQPDKVMLDEHSLYGLLLYSEGSSYFSGIILLSSQSLFLVKESV